MHSFIHFSRTKDVISHLQWHQKIFLMGVQENEYQISQNCILQLKFSVFYPCFHNSCEIWHSFSQPPMRNFLCCYYGWLIPSLGHENVQKNATFFKLFWYKVFVHWELKLLNFLMDSILRQFPFGDHFITCHNLISWWCSNTVRRT